MNMQFLRGNPQAPKGHVIFIARSAADPRTVLCTYCIVPPIAFSLTKYFPAFLSAQLSVEELRDASSINVVPIPPMLEEGISFEHLQKLAEHRDDDLCDLGSINPRDEAIKGQKVQEGCYEYGQLYHTYAQAFDITPVTPGDEIAETSAALDDLDAEDLLIQTMTDRERLTELGKLIGVARYASEGHDTGLLAETKQKMQRIGGRMAEKYRVQELISAAMDASERGAQLAELYLERGFKLLDEEYAEIPRIERAIRELQN